eukprot:770228-Pleurochrysis_carterae.AAC.1
MMVDGSTSGRAALSSSHSSSLSSSSSSLSAEGCGGRRIQADCARCGCSGWRGRGSYSRGGGDCDGRRSEAARWHTIVRGFDAAARDLEGAVGTLLALASGMTGALSCTLARLAAVFSSGWDKSAP